MNNMSRYIIYIITIILLIGILIYFRLNKIQNISSKEMIQSATITADDDSITSANLYIHLSELQKFPTSKAGFLKSINTGAKLRKWAKNISEKEKEIFLNDFLNENDQNKLYMMMIALRYVEFDNYMVLNKILNIAENSNEKLTYRALRILVLYQPKNEQQKEKIFNTLYSVAKRENKHFLLNEASAAFNIDKRRSIEFNKLLIKQANIADDPKFAKRAIKNYIQRAEKAISNKDNGK